MMNMDESNRKLTIDIANSLASELAEYAARRRTESRGEDGGDSKKDLSTSYDVLIVEYDRRIVDEDLRIATRSRFVSKHYADAVEAGAKALNECVRKKSGRTEDGDGLMTIAFAANGGLLRINKGRSKSDESAQRGHMFLCQGVVGAWRNPRAHALVDDSPERALMMLETINDLIQTTKRATRARRKR